MRSLRQPTPASPQRKQGRERLPLLARRASRIGFLVLAFFYTLATSAVAAPPNVVMIIGDDQAWTDYGFMGHPHIRTPHLDKLAAESLVFKRGYVPSSLCRASLATMITGLYPHQHLITSNDPTVPEGVASGAAMKNEKYLADRAKMIANFEKSPNLAKLLGTAGYVSHQSGKWWDEALSRVRKNS